MDDAAKFELYLLADRARITVNNLAGYKLREEIEEVKKGFFVKEEMDADDFICNIEQVLVELEDEIRHLRERFTKEARALGKRPSEMSMEELTGVGTLFVLDMPRDWQEEWLVEMSGTDGAPSLCDYKVIWDKLYPGKES